MFILNIYTELNFIKIKFPLHITRVYKTQVLRGIFYL